MPDINATMDKLTGLAALFSPEGITGTRTLSLEAACGICIILEDCARDLEQIGRQTEEAMAWKSDRERRLERFMDDVADRMDQEPEDWNFRVVAGNIRKQLSR